MPDSSATPDLDLTFLYEIADGSDEFVVESIDMLLQQAPEMLNSIDQALQSADWPTAAAAAHKLKPSMGFFGMLISQGLLQDVELLCKAGGQEPDEIRAKYNQAKELVETNLTALSRIKSEKEAGI
ncbi:Hpt domain-containing protein [Mucilaginibacter sp. BT774]|uniref:Hpt domain-containing protein n=1 Tax=Mucilaginibacter sp. BT774 TaxID=3062276 RepID=UPI0026743E63|nr:Hpt domain-containing protein [Mucilaginibacter sp. BT774]MDO3626170.1 Hpt domain-containing protein [Mucilaginibacter sp. BT774]